jgi:hypothetical protein
LTIKTEKCRPSTLPSRREEQLHALPSLTTSEEKSPSGKFGTLTSSNSRKRTKIRRKAAMRRKRRKQGTQGDTQLLSKGA